MGQCGEFLHIMQLAGSEVDVGQHQHGHRFIQLGFDIGVFTDFKLTQLIPTQLA